MACKQRADINSWELSSGKFTKLFKENSTVLGNTPGAHNNISITHSEKNGNVTRTWYVVLVTTLTQIRQGGYTHYIMLHKSRIYRMQQL